MVKTTFDDHFKKEFLKIKDQAFKNKIKKQIKKIIKNPEIRKPMKYARKNTREVYIKSYRLSYSYLNNQLTLLDLYHKNKQ